MYKNLVNFSENFIIVAKKIQSFGRVMIAFISALRSHFEYSFINFILNYAFIFNFLLFL